MQTAILLKVREKENITIGRGIPGGPANKIQINSQYISSNHCLLVPEDGSLVITDTSRNGTWVSCNSFSETTVTSCSNHSRINSIKNVHKTSAILDSNTYIILIPPVLSKLANEIVGLHFTGLDANKEFYHLECIKLKSMLENRQLMTFFTHMSVGKEHQYAAIANNCHVQLSRKRIRPISEENNKATINHFHPDGDKASLYGSGCGFDLTDGDECKIRNGWKSHSLKEDSSRSPPKDGECTPPSKSLRVELEQCQFCFKDFPINELIDHCEKCSSENRDVNPNHEAMLEHCQKCLKTFPISELIRHSNNCKITQENHSECCMKCFKDFPLSELVHHSDNCKVSLKGINPTKLKLIRTRSNPF